MQLQQDRIYLVVAKNYQCYDTWCGRYGISRYAPNVRYVDRPEQARGYSPEKLTIISVCHRDWFRDREYNRSRSLHELVHHLRMYVDLGAEEIYDTCIDNPPTEAERREYQQMQEQWAAEARRQVLESRRKGTDGTGE